MTLVWGNGEKKKEHIFSSELYWEKNAFAKQKPHKTQSRKYFLDAEDVYTEPFCFIPPSPSAPQINTH